MKNYVILKWATMANIAEIAEAGSLDVQACGSLGDFRGSATIDFADARAYLKRIVRERIAQLTGTLPDHIQAAARLWLNLALPAFPSHSRLFQPKSD